MDACKCVVYSRHGGTLNNLRATSPLVRLVEGGQRWEAPDHPQGVLPLNWGETELTRSVTCMEFQSTVQQIYRWKEEVSGVVKIEAELILEANRLQLMKQDLEKAENA
ncbi:uncharacterized protein TNCV_4616321 [Trichonephila clavipes]|nr:uncharacterized protein TNCV_4616321 [Trichonephila clavipes]